MSIPKRSKALRAASKNFRGPSGIQHASVLGAVKDKPPLAVAAPSLPGLPSASSSLALMQETRAAMTANYDAILIGSGIGALTVAVGLARQKRWRCLILEQNFNLGGMTQEFVRKRRYHFDVGLHYVQRDDRRRAFICRNKPEVAIARAMTSSSFLPVQNPSRFN